MIALKWSLKTLQPGITTKCFTIPSPNSAAETSIFKLKINEWSKFLTVMTFKSTIGVLFPCKIQIM